MAVAIPALVGGMAAAFGAFGLWWWCSKRNKKQRRVSRIFPYPISKFSVFSVVADNQADRLRTRLISRNGGKRLRERNNVKEPIQLDDHRSPVQEDLQLPI